MLRGMTMFATFVIVVAVIIVADAMHERRSQLRLRDEYAKRGVLPK